MASGPKSNLYVSMIVFLFYIISIISINNIFQEYILKLDLQVKCQDSEGKS